MRLYTKADLQVEDGPNPRYLVLVPITPVGRVWCEQNSRRFAALWMQDRMAIHRADLAVISAEVRSQELVIKQ